jgi:hypothetical protein
MSQLLELLNIPASRIVADVTYPVLFRGAFADDTDQLCAENADEARSMSRRRPCLIEICRLLEHRYAQLVDANTRFDDYEFGADVRVNPSHLALALEAHAAR